MGLQMRMLYARGDVGAFVDHIGLGESGVDVADMRVDLDHGVVDGIQHEGIDRVVQLWRPLGHGLLGVEYRRQHLVLHDEPPAALFRRPGGVGQDRGDALAGEADGAVEEAGVVRIHERVGVDRRAEPPARYVLPGVDPVHAGNRECGGLVDRDDPGVCVR